MRNHCLQSERTLEVLCAQQSYLPLRAHYSSVQGIAGWKWSKGANLSCSKKGMKSSKGQEPVVECEGTDDVDVLGVAATETTQKTLECDKIILQHYSRASRIEEQGGNL